MNPESLKALVTSTFSNDRFPAGADVVAHECDECNGIRSAFAGQAPATVNPDAVSAYASSLALFTPSAFHHFLASYLLFAIDHPASEVASCLPYALGPEEVDAHYAVRLGLFSPQEKAATVAVLRYLRTQDPCGKDKKVYDLVSHHWTVA